MAEHIVTLTDAEEAYLTSHGSTFEGIIAGQRVEWARAMASEARVVEFETWVLFKDSEIVQAAMQAELEFQAEALQVSLNEITTPTRFKP